LFAPSLQFPSERTKGKGARQNIVTGVRNYSEKDLVTDESYRAGNSSVQKANKGVKEIKRGKGNPYRAGTNGGELRRSVTI